MRNVLLTAYPNDAFTVDVDVFYVNDPGIREDVAQDLSAIIERSDGALLDTYTNDAARILILRASGGGSMINALANYDLTEQIDLVPEPRLDHDAFTLLQDIEELPDFLAPDDGAPVVGMLDTGIVSGHPTSCAEVHDAAVLDAALGGSADEHGHGTAVAGILLLGDVRTAVSSAGPITLPVQNCECAHPRWSRADPRQRQPPPPDPRGRRLPRVGARLQGREFEHRR